jgi:hypothetical protein
MWDPFANHRGPYVLQVARPNGVKRGRDKGYPVRFELLPGTVSGSAEEIIGEVQALLADPRDTIETVYVWSVPEQQHVTTFKRKAGL